MNLFPVNRVQLFQFTYRTHLTFLIKLSMLLFCFFLPLFFINMIRGGFEQIYWQDVASSDAKEMLQFYFSQSILFDILNIPCYAIAGVGLAGAYSLMKAYTFGDGYILKETFFHGVRENGKESVAITLIIGSLYVLMSTSKNMLAMYEVQFYSVMLMIEIIFGIILFGVYIFSLCQIVIYRNPIVRTIKNAVLFTFSVLPKIVGVMIITYIPLVLAFYSASGIVLAIVLFLFFGIGFGNAVLITTLFCQSCFDKMVNIRSYPEIYRKGLFDGEENAR